MKQLKDYLMEAKANFANDPINKMIEDLKSWWKQNLDPTNFEKKGDWEKLLKEIADMNAEGKEPAKVKEFFDFLEEKYSKPQVEKAKTDLLAEISQLAIDMQTQV